MKLINTAVATSVVGGSNVNAFEPENIHSQSEEQPMDVTEEESNPLPTPFMLKFLCCHF